MKYKEESLRFETVTLGLPPLKMILVEAGQDVSQGESQLEADAPKPKKDSEEYQTILKLIAHLTENN